MLSMFLILSVRDAASKHSASLSRQKDEWRSAVPHSPVWTITMPRLELGDRPRKRIGCTFLGCPFLLLRDGLMFGSYLCLMGQKKREARGGPPSTPLAGGLGAGVPLPSMNSRLRIIWKLRAERLRPHSNAVMARCGSVLR